MQVQTQDQIRGNRTAILEKALDVARKVHELAVWTVAQQVKIPIDLERELFNFEVEWLKSEVKRLWGVEILKEEALYVLQKAVFGF
ncbi:MAG: hypothetical protein C0177_00470 [Fervidicoccus fontis]|nr:MAG: hypothetical protein C0177_00470 [Fervidicoccus fontis]